MRPIPAPRIGDSHGLLRAINERERIRLDEFVTEFSADELFPPDMKDGLGRTRQFISFARAAGLLKEDRGTVELTEIGKRYVRSGDAEQPFTVSDAQAEWLRRQLTEKHMTDSIFHGLAIGLSLLSSVPPGTRISTLDFGRSLGHLGRAGWDNDNTLQIQGERYLDLLRDLDLIDAERSLTQLGHTVKGELTLPIHMSLTDIAAQLNPGGAEAVRTEGEAEWAAAQAPPEPAAPPAAEPAAAGPAPVAHADEEDEWQDVGPGSARPAAAAATPEDPGPPPPAPTAPPPAEPAPAPAAAASGPPPPAPPSDIWDTAEPHETTRAYAVVRPEAAAPPAAAPAERPQDAATVISTPAETPAAPPPAAPAAPSPPPAAAPPSAAAAPPPAAAAPPAAAPPQAPAAPARAASGFLDAGAIRSAAERQGLRLPSAVYANVAAALASGKHVVITGAPGSGKTTLALAVAQAAAASGRSSGAVLVTAAERWTADDTMGAADGSPGHVVEAARRGKWLVVDELDRAPLDAALGALSTFLAGLPVTLPTREEATPPGDWRIVATASASAEAASAPLMRRFAQVAIPAPGDADVDAVIRAAAGGDETAVAAARRLVGLREVLPLGAGVFADAARHAAERNAIEPTDERTLAREAYTAYVERLAAALDESGRVRLLQLVEAL